MDWVLRPTGAALDVIELRGITAYGYHGATPEERRNGQTFHADLRLHLDSRAAGESDDLSLTVDYAQMARAVVDVLAGPAMNLLETVADRIAKTVLEHEPVEVVEVTVHKPNASLGAQIADVSVHLRRAAHSWRETTFVAPDSAIFEAVGEAERRAGLAGPGFGEELPEIPAEHAGPVEPIQSSQAPASQALEADRPSPPLRTPAAEAAQAAEPPAEPTGVPARRRRVAATNWPVASIDQVPDHPVDAIIGLGANLGEALATLRSALADLREEPGIEVVAVSPLARTAPVGYENQPDFFNAVAHIRTTLSPRALLRTLQGIEEKHGRQRSVRWGPRTLDLDLIAYDTLLADEEDLTLPHPSAHERSFVLVPWSLMAPGAFLPGLGGGPVADLAEAAPDKGCIRWLAPDWDRPARASRPVAPDAAPPALADPGADQPQSADQAAKPLPEPLPTPMRPRHLAAGPGVPGFFAEARRGHSAFRGMSSANLDPPLKAVPYQPLPAPRSSEPPANHFEPRLESASDSPPMPYRHPASEPGAVAAPPEALPAAQPIEVPAFAVPFGPAFAPVPAPAPAAAAPAPVGARGPVPAASIPAASVPAAPVSAPPVAAPAPPASPPASPAPQQPPLARPAFAPPTSTPAPAPSPTPAPSPPAAPPEPQYDIGSQQPVPGQAAYWVTPAPAQV
jgi:dihydroneopterin aldolase/2-amino-4-hydroxy-6-hydroxymethyldihydropteridine diphosphokinase